NEVLDFVRRLPADTADREKYARDYIEGQLTAQEKDRLPQFLQMLTASDARRVLWGDLIRLESTLPRDRQKLSYTINLLSEMSRDDWASFVDFLNTLPEQSESRRQTIGYLVYWMFNPDVIYAKGMPVYSPFFHVTDNRVLWSIHIAHLVVMVLFTL